MSAATEMELESELALEGESEFASELEQEAGLAQELVGEFELEHEEEAEHEAFFNHLAAMADRTGRSQALRRIALAAARQALRGSRAGNWPVIEGESDAESGELEAGMGEFELGEAGELEAAPEAEFESTPAQQAQFAAMMEHAGHSAAEAANEQEAAEHFLPLIGLAAKFVLPKLAGLAAKKLGGLAAKKIGGRLISRVGGQLLRRVAPRLLRRVTPQLTRGLANVTRTLYRNRSTRPLLHAVPRIARTTIVRLGRQIASGRRITPRQAVRTLAQQTARTLSNPRTLAQTYRRSLALDRRYHRRTRRLLGRPVGDPVRAVNDAAVGSVNGMAAPVAGYPGAIGAPVAPSLVPGGIPGAGGWPMPATGGCRCQGQPAGMAMPAPTCPTCGR